MFAPSITPLLSFTWRIVLISLCQERYFRDARRVSRKYLSVKRDIFVMLVEYHGFTLLRDFIFILHAIQCLSSKFSRFSEIFYVIFIFSVYNVFGGLLMTLREKIDVLKDARHLNNRQLSIQSGIPYSTIDNWYKRAQPDDMRLSTFLTLCDFFGVTMDSMAYDEKEIVYQSDTGISYSAEEAALVRGFRAANPDAQEIMITLANKAIAKEKGRLTSESIERASESVEIAATNQKRIA